ncbi:MAG TPA: roadblock/LC7 domain-containing protein [Streptosporangiaceae bacterium]|jgi:predicted regulator of Ras-like GTPase activity (Roadblock/LC7/MglB family)|nr:roadblock/LC7 domain-containing protein [Streptosporangiaceae bacterium]
MPQAGLTATMSWVLDDLVRRVDGISQAVVLSRDGLTLGASQGLSREDAEHLAAVAAGMQSLARGAALRFDGGQARQSIIHMDRALLFVMAAAQGSCLAVLSPADADHGLIAYEMAMLVKRLGQYLSANPRVAVVGLTPERLSE